MAPVHTLSWEQHDSLAFNGVDLRPQRKLTARTATLMLALDIRADVTVAGGTTDGALVREGIHRLVKAFRLRDGSTTPVVEIEPRALIQLTRRRGMQAPSGLELASAGVQAATPIRMHYVIPFADRWQVKPSETYLVPRDPDRFIFETEWAGITNAALAAALITGGDRTVTVANLAVDILQIHDPALYVKAPPLFVPRILSYERAAPASSAQYESEIDTPRWVRLSMLHSLDADVSTEGVITVLGIKDDTRDYPRQVLARSFHEQEQWLFGGVGDEANIALAYFLYDFADNGRLGNILAPTQGGRPRWLLTVVGGASRIVKQINVELERVPGLTAPELPAELA